MAGSRILAFPSKLRQLWSLDFLRPYFCETHKRDTLFFLTHDYYLSRYFSLAQRIDCALAHYGFERQQHGAGYRRSVYQSPRGLTLWHRTVDGTEYRIVLCVTDDLRYEGDLSVLCLVEGTRVCRLSFSYVSGQLFGLPPEPTMFVTRNQTDRNPQLQRFRDAFKHNSPPYFCVAALCGIAMANGMRRLAMIKDEAQIAYSKLYEQSFRNSYSGLWEALGACNTEGPHAYILSLPLKMAPLTDVSHRSRAVARRRNWLEIALSARHAMLEHRTNRVPAPLEAAPEALLPPEDEGYLVPVMSVPNTDNAPACKGLPSKARYTSPELR